MSAEEWVHATGLAVVDLELFALLCDAYEAGQEDERENDDPTERGGLN